MSSHHRSDSPHYVPPRVPWPIDGLTISAEQLRDSGAACSHDGTPLDLHQPDPRRSNRMLGTCPGCGAWTVIYVLRAPAAQPAAETQAAVLNARLPRRAAL
jgi:hypothetical protein